MKERKLPEALVVKMAEAVKLMGNPQRIRIVEHLDRNGESTVGAIAKALNYTPSVVSQQLTRLRLGGIIVARRESREVYCTLISESARTILACMRRRYAGQKR